MASAASFVMSPTFTRTAPFRKDFSTSINSLTPLSGGYSRASNIESFQPKNGAGSVYSTVEVVRIAYEEPITDFNVRNSWDLRELHQRRRLAWSSERKRAILW